MVASISIYLKALNFSRTAKALTVFTTSKCRKSKYCTAGVTS